MSQKEAMAWTLKKSAVSSKTPARPPELRRLAESEDGRALNAMFDAAALARAVSNGDQNAIQGVLRQVLNTEEGRRIAKQLSDAMGQK